jgi:hypothetical protein
MAKAQRAQSSSQQSETLISSSNYGLYFRGYNGAEITLDNNGKPKWGDLDLESLPGQLYWNNEYLLAKLYLKNQQSLGEFKVKFEQLNQVFYVLTDNDKVTKVADPSMIERVEFLSSVNGWEAPVFKNMFNDMSGKTKGLNSAYLQELVIGKISLYKSNKSIVRFKDSLFGSIKKPFLVPQPTYYLFYKGDYKELKKMNLKNVANAFPILENELRRLKAGGVDWDDDKQVVENLRQLNVLLNKKESQ